MPSQKLQFMLCNLTVATWSETVEKSVCVSGRNYVVSLDMCVCVYQFVNYIAHHFVRPPEKKTDSHKFAKKRRHEEKHHNYLFFIWFFVHRLDVSCMLHCVGSALEHPQPASCVVKDQYGAGGKGYALFV